jgi:hypothetical protein
VTAGVDLGSGGVGTGRGAAEGFAFPFGFV